MLIGGSRSNAAPISRVFSTSGVQPPPSAEKHAPATGFQNDYTYTLVQPVASQPVAVQSVAAPPSTVVGDRLKPTIIELIHANQSLTTLYSWMAKGGLLHGALSHRGNLFTVLAPSNAAFDALPPSVVSRLLTPGNEDALDKVFALFWKLAVSVPGPTAIACGREVSVLQSAHARSRAHTRGARCDNDSRVCVCARWLRLTGGTGWDICCFVQVLENMMIDAKRCSTCPPTVYPLSSLTNGELLPTVAGGRLQVLKAGSLLTVNGSHIIAANIAASNGLVHVIDKVIV